MANNIRKSGIAGDRFRHWSYGNIADIYSTRNMVRLKGDEL